MMDERRENWEWEVAMTLREWAEKARNMMSKHCGDWAWFGLMLATFPAEDKDEHQDRE